MDTQDFDTVVRSGRWTATMPLIDPDQDDRLDRLPVYSPLMSAVRVEGPYPRRRDEKSKSKGYGRLTDLQKTIQRLTWRSRAQGQANFAHPSKIMTSAPAFWATTNRGVTSAKRCLAAS